MGNDERRPFSRLVGAWYGLGLPKPRQGAGRGRADGAGLPSRGRAVPRLCALLIAAISNTEFAFTMCMFVGERVAGERASGPSFTQQALSP